MTRKISAPSRVRTGNSAVATKGARQGAEFVSRRRPSKASRQLVENIARGPTRRARDTKSAAAHPPQSGRDVEQPGRPRGARVEPCAPVELDLSNPKTVKF